MCVAHDVVLCSAKNAQLHVGWLAVGWLAGDRVKIQKPVMIAMMTAMSLFC